MCNHTHLLPARILFLYTYIYIYTRMYTPPPPPPPPPPPRNSELGVGVCASRSGGGTSDNRTLPEYSPRPACDGGGHCATAGTPTQNAAYTCGV